MTNNIYETPKADVVEPQSIQTTPNWLYITAAAICLLSFMFNAIPVVNYDFTVSMLLLASLHEFVIAALITLVLQLFKRFRSTQSRLIIFSSTLILFFVYALYSIVYVWLSR